MLSSTTLDAVSSLRAAALSTLRAKRKKPGIEKATLLRPPPPDSIQLDYGLQDEAASFVTVVQHEPVSEPVEIREEGEISEEEESLKETAKSPSNEPKSPVRSSPARQASHFSPRRTPEASPVSRRHKPSTPSGRRIQLTATQMALLSLDANHVRPGLQMTQPQYEIAKDIILDLLGWGVPPEFLVECGLSREIVFYVFVELNLRLPQNLDTAGLIPYTPDSVAAAQKAAALSMEQESDPASPRTPIKADNGASAISPNSLHDMEMQRKQELLARKRAVIASRKPKTAVCADVDSFLKSITPPSASTPPSSASVPASDDAMDVDDIPGLGISYPPPTEALRPGIEKSDSISSVNSSTSTASRRGTKRPVASDFVDLDTHPRMNGSRYSYARKSAIDFGSVSNGNRRCVIDLSDSEEETEGMLRPDDGGEQGSMDPTPGSSTSQLELEIQRMKELIAMKERERLKKLALRVHGSGEGGDNTEVKREWKETDGIAGDTEAGAGMDQEEAAGKLSVGRY
ncbi:hypothetical protein APHAL10511_002719 [Amanita phalloides]|nr:hypothetical protein APHAL10511_002719 [Amanita phalloides]